MPYDTQSNALLLFRIPAGAEVIDFGRLDTYVREALRKIANEVRDDVRQFAPVDRGKLRRSIRSSVTGNWRKGFTGKVYAHGENPGKVRALEFGWPKGVTPNIGALQRWARRKGMRPAEDAGFRIALAMKRRGFKDHPHGWRFFTKAEREFDANAARHQATLNFAIEKALG